MTEFFYQCDVKVKNFWNGGEINTLTFFSVPLFIFLNEIQGKAAENSRRTVGTDEQ